MPAAIQSIVFDLGNVLMFHDNAFLARAIAARGGAEPAAVAEQLEQRLWPRTDRGQLPGDALRRELCGWLGVELDAEEFFALWTCHLAPNEPMLARVAELVGRFRLLLLSNTNELHARYCLERMPLLQRFDHLLFSHELGLVKPDPRIFEQALARAGSPPEATAFFDDIPAYVEGALRAGIRAQVFRGVDAFPEQLRSLGIAAG